MLYTLLVSCCHFINASFSNQIVELQLKKEYRIQQPSPHYLDFHILYTTAVVNSQFLEVLYQFSYHIIALLSSEKRQTKKLCSLSSSVSCPRLVSAECFIKYLEDFQCCKNKHLF